jgi:signal transduction histidine kinase
VTRLPERRTPGRLFRKYAVVFVALVSGALLTSGLVQFAFSYQETQTALIDLQREKAAGAAVRIEQFVKEIEHQLAGAIPAQPEGRSVAPAQLRSDYEWLLHQAPAITEVAYLDASGHEQLRVSRLAMTVEAGGVDYAGDPKFLEPSAGRTYFSPVYFRLGSEPYMTIAVADRGPDAGVVVAEVNLKFIWEVVSRINIGAAGYAYVVDSDGRLIAHPDISLVLQRPDLSGLPQVRAAQARVPEEPTIARDLRGQQVLTARAPIVPLGWSAFVEQPLEEAYAPLYASILRTTVLLLVGLGLAVLASLVLARRMVKPIQALTAGTTRIGAGALDQRIEVGTGDELDELGAAFNHMAAQLRESYGTLEDNVTERTRGLAEALGHVRALGEVSQAVNSSLDLQEVLTTIVARAVQLSGTDGGWIYEFDATAQDFELRATHRISPELIDAIHQQRARLGNSVVGRAAVQRAAIQVPDLRDEPGDALSDALERAGLRALLAVPLLRENQIVGALVVLRSHLGAFQPDTVDLLQTFAAQSVLAIHNARLFQELEHKSRQLELASHHKSQFLANMSHELRTPLNAILGYTELILDGIYGETPQRVRDVLERVDKSGHHLLGLINDVLDLSKIEAGQLVLSLNEYSLPDVVQTVFAAMDPLAAEKRLALTLTLADDLPVGIGDERRVAQVLMNLIGNAVKFTDAGEVSVHVATSDGALLVSVSDTGPGIAEADQQRIFGEFQQVDGSSTRHTGGTGLGLSIARRIVELHGGKLWVKSTPRAGSTFSFTLPVRVAQRTAVRI